MIREPNIPNENISAGVESEKGIVEERLLRVVADFLEKNKIIILNQKISEDGFKFETKQGKFFIPAYSFPFIANHPEILVSNGIFWEEIKNIDPEAERRYFKGVVGYNGREIILFRKDSNTKDREGDLRLDYPLQESRNSVHLGGGKSIIISEQISFRVPEHYATTPHGVIMEYLEQNDVLKFVEGLREEDAEKVLDAYKELAFYLYHKYGNAFFIPPSPLEKYEMGGRMVFVESYDKDSGKIQFIITDLKNRTAMVDWDEKEK